MSTEEPDEEEKRRQEEQAAQEAARRAEQAEKVARMQESIQQWVQNGNQIGEVSFEELPQNRQEKLIAACLVLTAAPERISSVIDLGLMATGGFLYLWDYLNNDGTHITVIHSKSGQFRFDYQIQGSQDDNNFPIRPPKGSFWSILFGSYGAYELYNNFPVTNIPQQSVDNKTYLSPTRTPARANELQITSPSIPTHPVDKLYFHPRTYLS